MFGCATELELFEAAETNYSDFEALHQPLSIVYRGQRHNLKVSTGSEDLAAVSAADGTKFSVRITADNTLHLERVSEGDRSCIKTFTSAFDGLPQILWSDESEQKPQKNPTQPGLGMIRPSVERHPSGPLTPEVRAAALAFFEYLASLCGAGKIVLVGCSEIFEVLADLGIRIRGRGEKLKKLLQHHTGIDLPGGMRVFRYAMATCRKMGLLVSEGTLEVFPFDDLHNPASDFARAVVAFAKTLPAQPSNNVPPSTRASEAPQARPNGAQDPSDVAPASPAASGPTDAQPPVELYPVDTWPFQGNTLRANEAKGANHSGDEGACDLGGAAADHVNWFGHKTHVPDGLMFAETSIGLDVLEASPEPVTEEFYDNLAKAFTSDPSGGSP